MSRWWYIEHKYARYHRPMHTKHPLFLTLFPPSYIYSLVQLYKNNIQPGKKIKVLTFRKKCSSLHFYRVRERVSIWFNIFYSNSWKCIYLYDLLMHTVDRIPWQSVKHAGKPIQFSLNSINLRVKKLYFVYVTSTRMRLFLTRPLTHCMKCFTPCFTSKYEHVQK